jgi:hypothetical protein
VVAYFQANAETADVFAIRLSEKIKKAVEAWAKRESNVRLQNAPKDIWHNDRDRAGRIGLRPRPHGRLFTPAQGLARPSAPSPRTWI